LLQTAPKLEQSLQAVAAMETWLTWTSWRHPWLTDIRRTSVAVNHFLSELVHLDHTFFGI
jgi:hypothetical protein